MRVKPSIFSLLKDGGERLALLFGGKDGALHQPRQVLEGVQRLVEAGKIDGNLLERLLFESKLEQGGRIAAGYA